RKQQVDFGPLVAVVPYESEMPASSCGDGRASRKYFAGRRIGGFAERNCRRGCSERMTCGFERVTITRSRHVPQDFGVGVEAGRQRIGEKKSNRNAWRGNHVRQEGGGVDGGTVGQRSTLIDRSHSAAGIKCRGIRQRRSARRRCWGRAAGTGM